MDKHVFLDAGHGGLNFEGQYDTWPAKKHLFPVSAGLPENELLFPYVDANGQEYVAFYEGVWNRNIVYRVAATAGS